MAASCAKGGVLASSTFRKLLTTSYSSHLLAFSRGQHVQPYQKDVAAAAQPDDDLSKVDSGHAHVALNSKNLEEHQEEVVAAESESFWVPDPETGVFAPAEEEGDIDVHCSLPAPPHSTGDGGGSSVLEQRVWVREEIEVEEFERNPNPHIDVEKEC